MKKFLISAGLIGIFGFYILYQKVGFNIGDDNHTVLPPSGVSSGGTSAPSESTNPNAGNTGSGSNPPATPGSGSVSSGQYKNGQYTGSVADAFYGNVQVKAIIQGGKITDVQFLQYPSDRSTSVYINSQAMPYLTQEAIQAQSAQIDGVSGATATSGAFEQSLASALAQARI